MNNALGEYLNVPNELFENLFCFLVHKNFIFFFLLGLMIPLRLIT